MCINQIIFSDLLVILLVNNPTHMYLSDLGFLTAIYRDGGAYFQLGGGGGGVVKRAPEVLVCRGVCGHPTPENVEMIHCRRALRKNS